MTNSLLVGSFAGWGEMTRKAMFGLTAVHAVCGEVCFSVQFRKARDRQAFR